MILRILAITTILLWILIFFKGYKNREYKKIYFSYILILIFFLIYIFFDILKNGSSSSAFFLFVVSFFSVVGMILWVLKLLKWEDFEFLKKVKLFKK